jgi:FSR family fosmidomycin resistance protein-like MFS transporter
VAMAQELAPKGKSMVSSLMMGLALGTGGILSPIVGKLADVYTLKLVLIWLPVVPLLSILFVMRLPKIGGFNSKN